MTHYEMMPVLKIRRESGTNWLYWMSDAALNAEKKERRSLNELAL